MNDAKDILSGLAVFVVVAGLIFGVFFTGITISSKNNEKVQKMTTFCIEQGYRGWDSGSNRTGISACVRD